MKQSRLRRIGAVGIATALFSAVLTTATAGPVHAAPGDPFPENEPVIFISQGSGETTLYRATLRPDGSEWGFDVEGTFDVEYNGIGWNPNDGYIYGVVTESDGPVPMGNVVRVGQGGVVTDTGISPGLGYTAWSGDFNTDNGRLYTINSTANTMTSINVATGATSTIAVTGVPSGLTIFDFVYSDGFFWALSGGNLIRIDPASGQARAFPVNFGESGSIGAAWRFGNGNLGFGANAGTMYQVSVQNPGSASPTIELIATQSTPNHSRNDGTSVPGLPTDLRLQKTGDTNFVGGQEFQYQLTVTNEGPGVSSGWTITDELPDGVSLVSVDGAQRGSDATTGRVSFYGGRLDVNEQRVVTLTVRAEGVDERCVSNFATVLGNEDDPDPDNSSDTHESCQALLDVRKTSDATADARPGDTVTYTVTATNTSETDYTADNPAVVFDDLSGVLDDADYNGDAVASRAGSVGYEAPLLSWAGALPAGESVDLTYTATLKSGGDGEVRNVAWQPDDPEDPTPPTCDTSLGADPETGEPCAEVEYLLPRLTVEKTADRTDLPAVGETVEYTVTVTNQGPGVYTSDEPATFTDDLSDVVDDADYNNDASASVGSVSYDAPELSWEGALGAGESAVITYTATYTGEGDKNLRNLVCVPESEAVPGTDPCDVVNVPAAGLIQWKQVESSDSPAAAGSVLTYTLFFENDGNAAAEVDAVDDLTHVTDDADVTVEPTSPDGLDAVRDGNRISVTGRVPAGETHTVTYQVTVKPDGERGDDRAANFLLPNDPEDPPAPPETPDCVPSDEERPDCTMTPIAALSYTKSVEASSDPVEEGTVLTYTITVRNDGAATAPVEREDVLTEVLDDADLTSAPVSDTASVTVSEVAEGRFQIGGELAAGETAVITYQATVKAQADRGNNRADNFLVPPGGTPPEGPCEEGDEECTSTPLPELSVSKASEPEPGTTVVADQEVTYTLTFTNSGDGAGTVDYVDRLTGVLDDAVITQQPAASDGALTVSLNSDDTLAISGVLAGGQTVTVSYTVRVLPDGQRGDNRLGNVLAPAGEESPDCETDGVSCTTHPIPLLESWKQVEADATPVAEGTVLTYTLFFENSGEAAADVDYVDDLTHVIDDADVSTEPTSPDGLAATRDGHRIAITGEVPAGETRTVTYQVTIRADGERNDDIAANFLLLNDPEDPPTPPDTPVCQPEDPERPDCTTTPIGRLTTGKTVSADTDPVGAGTVLTYTLTFDNQGEGPITVEHTDHMADVLDDADLIDAPTASDSALTVSAVADERFTVTGELAAGQTVTVTYRVVVKEETERGNNTADNFLVPGDEEPPTECEPEDPNCTATPLPNVSVAKSSDPESGSDVQAGEEITYTLTFTNTGDAAGTVDFTDDLSGVLDDAALTGEPAASDPALVPTSGEDGLLRVTGSLEGGQTVTVSYTVTVNPDGDRGDNRIGNVVAKTGTPEPKCEDAGVSCTEHPVGELESWKTVDPASGSTLRPGEEATYTLHFENVGGAPVDVSRDDVLTNVLDDADVTVQPAASSDSLTVSDLVDGRFTVTGRLQAGETATVSYTVTVKPDGERGDDRLGNFLVPSGEEPPETCVPADDERSDCTVNHVSDVSVAKSSDPESGAKVSPGAEVTYTLAFTNESKNPDSAAVEVDYTDHMADVLDDAVLTSGPTVSDESLTATVEGDTIRVTGTVPSGEVATVAYTVKVKPYDEQGNHVLGNVVAVTGEEPVCAPDSDLCTKHDLPEPPSGGLPVTGGAISIAAVVFALLLTGSGVALVVTTRRRKAEADTQDAAFGDLM